MTSELTASQEEQLDYELTAVAGHHEKIRFEADMKAAMIASRQMYNEWNTVKKRGQKEVVQLDDSSSD